jgi:hypothetical protein
MKWLFLVHQVQTPNSRERVKVWRLIKKTGAVLHRNSVYVLPYSKEKLEDFQWVCQQIQDSKGEASVFVSQAQDKEEDTQLKRLFERARRQEFAELLTSSQVLLDRVILAKKQNRMTSAVIKSFTKEETDLLQLLEDIKRRNFFGGSAPRKLDRILSHLHVHLHSSEAIASIPLPRYDRKDFQGKVWTTRKDIHIDRLCSAWLISRFIDSKARFVFAGEKELPQNAIAFDVLGAEFSHHGESCTFETLTRSFQIRDSAIRIIGEMIHDVDLKDHKFGRPEGPGLDAIIRALSFSALDDHAALRNGSVILDALYKYYSKRSLTRK